MNHQVSDLIIRIKNAMLARRKRTYVVDTKLNKAICKVLIKEGFLEEVKEETVLGQKVLNISLKHDRKKPVFTDVIVISKPSLRVYATCANIYLLQRGMYTVVISTNQGVMSGREARKKGLGGEVLFKIW